MPIMMMPVLRIITFFILVVTGVGVWVGPMVVTTGLDIFIWSRVIAMWTRASFLVIRLFAGAQGAGGVLLIGSFPDLRGSGILILCHDSNDRQVR